MPLYSKNIKYIIIHYFYFLLNLTSIPIIIFAININGIDENLRKIIRKVCVAKYKFLLNHHSIYPLNSALPLFLLYNLKIFLQLYTHNFSIVPFLPYTNICCSNAFLNSFVEASCFCTCSIFESIDDRKFAIFVCSSIDGIEIENFKKSSGFTACLS